MSSSGDPALLASGTTVAKEAHVDRSRAGFDGYAVGLASTHRRLVSSLAKQRRRLSTAAGDVVFCADDRDPEALRRLLAWKSAQYDASGWRNPLTDTGVVELAHRIAGTTSAGFGGRVSTLRAGGTLIAAELHLYSTSVCAGGSPRTTARSRPIRRACCS